MRDVDYRPCRIGSSYITHQAAVVALGLFLFTPVTHAQLSITVITDPATEITGSGAVLNGTVNGNGEDISAVYFDWGLTASPYDNIYVNAVPFNVTAGEGQTPVSLALGGLGCGITYHFRVAADDMNGRTAVGEDMSFTTSACTNPAPVAEPVPSSTFWSLLALSSLIAGVAATIGRLRR